MSHFHLSLRSLNRLQGVHTDLVRVVVRAIQISPIDFAVTEGLRSADRQVKLFEEGKSQTLNSKHITGHAVDLAPIVNGAVPWHDWSAFETVAKAMLTAASELNVRIIWGGHWKSLRDGPHFELSK